MVAVHKLQIVLLVDLLLHGFLPHTAGGIKAIYIHEAPLPQLK